MFAKFQKHFGIYSNMGKFCKMLPKNAEEFDNYILGLRSAKACKSCRSRQELSNEYFLAKCGVDTEENEPYKV